MQWLLILHVLFFSKSNYDQSDKTKSYSSLFFVSYSFQAQNFCIILLIKRIRSVFLNYFYLKERIIWRNMIWKWRYFRCNQNIISPIDLIISVVIANQLPKIVKHAKLHSHQVCRLIRIDQRKLAILILFNLFI